MSTTLFPTSLVGSYPQPDWLIDRAQLSHRLPPRVRATDLWRVAPVSPRKIFTRGFLVSLTNPKPLVFYAAFLPQFLVADAPLNKQMAILSVTFVAIGFVVDSGWAFAGARARGLVARFGRARNRLTGAILVGAGAALGLALARL